MQVLWHIPWRLGEASLNHQRFCCAHVWEDKDGGNRLYHWLWDREKTKRTKGCLLKSSSKKRTKWQPYWFSKCSGILFSWRGDVCGVPGLFRRQMDQWRTNQPQGALPGVRCAIFFVPPLFCFCRSRMPSNPPYKQRGRRKKYNNSQARHFPIILAGEEQTATNDNSLVRKVCIQVRWWPLLVRLLPTTRAQCYYQPAQCQLATIKVPFKIEFCLALPKLTLCIQPDPLIPCQSCLHSISLKPLFCLFAAACLSLASQSPPWQPSLSVRPLSRLSFEPR